MGNARRGQARSHACPGRAACCKGRLQGPTVHRRSPDPRGSLHRHQRVTVMPHATLAMHASGSALAQQRRALLAVVLGAHASVPCPQDLGSKQSCTQAGTHQRPRCCPDLAWARPRNAPARSRRRKPSKSSSSSSAQPLPAQQQRMRAGMLTGHVHVQLSTSRHEGGCQLGPH